MKLRTQLSIIIFSVFYLMVCGLSAQPKNQLSQVATIDALLAGAYDGIMNNEELHNFGNFGLGTFDKLNGEMIVYNGNIYQIKYDGTVVKNNGPASTPFAVVVNFETDEVTKVNEINNIEKLIEELSSKIENKNLPIAVKISGNFEFVKVRSVPAQTKPYRPLAEVVKDQSVFEYNNISGTLIGFLLPEYFKSFNVSGLHIHFLSDDETKGGHLLDLKLAEGKVELDYLNKFYVYLPDDSEHFNNLDLQQDRSKELEKIEK